MNKERWQCRWSLTLGELESTHQEVWGTFDYIDDKQPTVFFGLYGLPDFYTLWRHKGRKAILWAGTDILHFADGYWLDKEGEIRVGPYAFGKWINENCESYVENEVEQLELEFYGIETKVIPSFLGNVNDFPVSYKWNSVPRLYTSVSGDNFEQYGWHKIDGLAEENPNVEFHLYGNEKKWIPKWSNIIVHGRVPKEQMNKEIEGMQGALRLTEFDGFSEILAKSILMGQHPISEISYNHIGTVESIFLMKDYRKPNLQGRNYYLKRLNKYPWNSKK